MKMGSGQQVKEEHNRASGGEIVRAFWDAPQYGDKVKNVQAVKLQFADRALQALRRLPGVRQVALTSTVPLTGENWVDELNRPDHPVPEAQRPPVNLRWINPEYMTTMQVPLVGGRAFTEADRGNPYIVMISERTAQEGFRNEDPVGKNIELHSASSMTICRSRESRSR